MNPGEIVELRSVYGGRVRWAFPHRVVADDGERFVLYLAPGTKGVWMGRDADGRYLERWMSDEQPHGHVWQRHHVLSLSRRGDAYSLWHFWDEAWSFVCWYVQLHTPMTEIADGFEMTDQALDVLVDPDGTWRWKDEDDFAEAQALGVFTAEAAAAVRDEGKRVIAARPWPTSWEEWRPDPAWSAYA
jgi:Protein of unknown function (DUF402)